MNHNFMPGDRVDYTGSKTFKDNKGNPLNLRGVIGTVLARVGKTDNGYTVEFDGDGFIMDAHVLTVHKYSKQEIERERAEVLVRRRRDEETE